MTLSTSQQYYNSSGKLHRQANAIRKTQQINKNNLCNSIIANVTINLYSKRNNNTSHVCNYNHQVQFK